ERIIARLAIVAGRWFENFGSGRLSLRHAPNLVGVACLSFFNLPRTEPNFRLGLLHFCGEPVPRFVSVRFEWKTLIAGDALSHLRVSTHAPSARTSSLFTRAVPLRSSQHQSYPSPSSLRRRVWLRRRRRPWRPSTRPA